MQAFFFFYFDNEIYLSFNLNFIFLQQLRKGMNAHKKMYEISWESASNIHLHT